MSAALQTTINMIMKKIAPFVFAVAALFVATTASAAPIAYIPNGNDASVSVVDTATNSVVATVPVGYVPYGVAVDNVHGRAYIANNGGGVTVIDTSTYAVLTSITVGPGPVGIAVNPAGTRVYVANDGENTVSVIDTQLIPPAVVTTTSESETAFSMAARWRARKSSLTALA